MRRGVAFLLVFACAMCATRQQLPSPGRKPVLLLVSFDGWRWDYDSKAPAPNLRTLAARGVRAEALIPAYPTKTVPNHYSIATGLYPGHHGMIANVIRDPASGRLFERSNRLEVENPMWWGGDPIWNVAQRVGIFAATMFWPGSEAPVGGMRPRFWREFDDTVPGSARIQQVLEWLDLPDEVRPGLITLYLNDTDTMGHWYGPDSQQVRDAIARTDEHFGQLVAGLDRRELLDVTNIVVISDHGMAATTRERTIVIDDLLAAHDVEISDMNPTLGVTPRAGTEEDVLYRALAAAHPNLRMYRREETPPHWRLREQPRVPPITGVADEGWVVLRRGDVDDYWMRSDNGGQHGYDPQLRSMRGIFVAAGPAFKEGVTVPAFENVAVYNVLALALGLRAPDNDGDPAIARQLLR